VVRFAVIVAGLLVVAVIATYARYESLDPCDWMEHDLAAESSLPQVAVELQISAAFLLDGITEPTAGDCLVKWWEWRREGLPEQE
jgi:hypothetical protein